MYGWNLKSKYLFVTSVPHHWPRKSICRISGRLDCHGHGNDATHCAIPFVRVDSEERHLGRGKNPQHHELVFRSRMRNEFLRRIEEAFELSQYVGLLGAVKIERRRASLSARQETQHAEPRYDGQGHAKQVPSACCQRTTSTAPAEVRSILLRCGHPKLSWTEDRATDSTKGCGILR